MSVNGANAMASEPRYISPLPYPMANGEPLRAPIRRLSLPVNRKASAKAPRNCLSVAATASAGDLPLFISCETRCATASVSVSLTNLQPRWSVAHATRENFQ